MCWTVWSRFYFNIFVSLQVHSCPINSFFFMLFHLSLLVFLWSVSGLLLLIFIAVCLSFLFNFFPLFILDPTFQRSTHFCVVQGVLFSWFGLVCLSVCLSVMLLKQSMNHNRIVFLLFCQRQFWAQEIKLLPPPYYFHVTSINAGKLYTRERVLVVQTSTNCWIGRSCNTEHFFWLPTNLPQSWLTTAYAATYASTNKIISLVKGRGPGGGFIFEYNTS